MLLVLTALIHDGQDTTQEKQELALLKLANTWLQRKVDGFQDSILLIGVNFPSTKELQEKVGPLGLGDADLEVVQLEEGEYLGELIEPVLSRWLYAKHRSAVSFLHWRDIQGERFYPDLNWWWMGVETMPADELSLIHEAMMKMLPAEFKSQAPTWLELLMRDSPVGMFDSEQVNFEIVMNALGICRWLHAYNQVSKNGFFEFDYREALRIFPVDLMRLSKESFQDNVDATAEAFDDEDATQDQLAAACLRVCLANRSFSLAQTLRNSFNNPGALLWALHTSIWPALTIPMNEAFNQLVADRAIELGNVMPQWEFVTEGWMQLNDE